MTGWSQQQRCVDICSLAHKTDRSEQKPRVWGSGEPLRELGWQAAVTIVSEEPYAPSQRPPLFQAFLSGNAQPTTLKFRSAEH
jgi:hypothetical protein